MAENSAIEWTDHTFNPWMGCTKVSPACANCYAETMMDHRYGKVRWGKGQPRQRTSAANWRKPLKWEREAEAFQEKHGRRQRVFCASLADVFDEEVPDEWRDDLFDIIHDCRSLDWLILTKRPEKMRDYLMGTSGAGAANFEAGGPWSHLWLGVTVEDQERADERVPVLLEIPARVRFLSMEPLLGPVDLVRSVNKLDWLDAASLRPGGIDWVIAGGESGPGARPSHPDWFRSLRDQCAAAGVPFLFKQWGGWAPGGHPLRDSRYVDLHGRWQLPDVDGAVMVHHAGKKDAGRTLDGVTHDGFPGVTR